MKKILAIDYKKGRSEDGGLERGVKELEEEGFYVDYCEYFEKRKIEPEECDIIIAHPQPHSVDVKLLYFIHKTNPDIPIIISAYELHRYIKAFKINSDLLKEKKTYYPCEKNVYACITNDLVTAVKEILNIQTTKNLK